MTSVSDLFLQRMLSWHKNKDTLPKSYKNKQTYPFLRLVKIDSTFQVYGNIIGAFKNNPADLAFTGNGSLGSFQSQTVFYLSPFEKAPFSFNNTDIINNSGKNVSNLDNLVFGTMPKFQGSTGELVNKKTLIFLSPSNAKWILLLEPDPMFQNNFIISIFFNPMQNIHLNKSQIQTNINTYCNLIGNQDPMCYCSGDLCVQSALFSAQNADTLKQKNPDEFDSISKHCSCLSNQCQYAASNFDTNPYAQSFATCNQPINACDANFIFNDYNGVFSDKNTYLWNQCPELKGSTSISPQTLPSTPTTPAISPTKPTSKDSSPPSTPAKSEPMSIGIKLAIAFCIVAVILSIAYFVV